MKKQNKKQDKHDTFILTILVFIAATIAVGSFLDDSDTRNWVKNMFDSSKKITITDDCVITGVYNEATSTMYRINATTTAVDNYPEMFGIYAKCKDKTYHIGTTRREKNSTCLEIDKRIFQDYSSLKIWFFDPKQVVECLY